MGSKPSKAVTPCEIESDEDKMEIRIDGDYQQKKTQFIQRTKALLKEAKQAHGQANKCKVCEQIFQHVVENKWFLDNYPKFARVVRSKLLELAPDWKNAESFHYTLFGEGFPGRVSQKAFPSAPPLESLPGCVEQSPAPLEPPQSDDQVVCRICFANKINTLILPCMHFYYCQECASTLKACSICNMKIDGRLKTYTPF